MNTKVDEGKLISGKEALTKVTEGIVQHKCDEDPVADRWTTITDHFWDQYNLGVFLNENTTWKFRLKPCTISINGIEVPAPFKPKDGDKTYYLNDGMRNGYRESEHLEHFKYHFGAWRTEEEVKQVVSALRQVFGGSHDN
ncbi:hypothetical protein [Acinetobacter sp. YH12100]|uniref:hypothetical protein n=1 Tax=Acinetobacter sp. YH12100 TaxID=2601089 RepID=UPI0015D277A2|nr:hypothetical protein [Acinetobacter sp. YH12100]